MRVLLVEDDTRIARIAMRALNERGAHVMWATELRTAGALCGTSWSVALVDLGLPEGQTAGLALLRQLAEEFPDRPRAAFTSSNDPAAATELVALNCEVIRKNADFEATLDAFLSHHKI